MKWLLNDTGRSNPVLSDVSGDDYIFMLIRNDNNSFFLTPKEYIDYVTASSGSVTQHCVGTYIIDEKGEAKNTNWYTEKK